MFIQTYEKTINNYSIFPVTKIENVYMLIYIYLNILLWKGQTDLFMV